MARRLPKSIRVMGTRIGVGVIEQLTIPADHEHPVEEGESADPHRAYGVYEGDLPIIWLDKDSGPERTKVTLVHESLHAMLNIARIDSVNGEEELVSRLAPVLFAWLRENKAAVAYLQEV